jgi:hypothetical protein
MWRYVRVARAYRHQNMSRGFFFRADVVTARSPSACRVESRYAGSVNYANSCSFARSCKPLQPPLPDGSLKIVMRSADKKDKVATWRQTRDQLTPACVYLRTRELSGALPAAGAPVGGVPALVLLQVGTASVEPTDGHTYDPTDGATTDPYPEVPACPADDPAVPACARAAVLETANAVASTIVVSFMAGVLSPKRTDRTYAGHCPCKRESLLTLLSI